MAVAAEESRQLHHKHAMLLATAQACWAEAKEAAAAMEGSPAISWGPGRSTLTSWSQQRSATTKTRHPKAEAPSVAPTSAADVEVPSPIEGRLQAFRSGSLGLSFAALRQADAETRPLQPPSAAAAFPQQLWERLDAWQSEIERFRQEAQKPLDTVAHAQRLGRVATHTLDASRARSLEALVEAQESELWTAQRADALERAALRRDEAVLARLVEELSSLEKQSPQKAVATTLTGDTGDQLLGHLVSREERLVQREHQVSAKLRIQLAEIRDSIAHNEREVSLLSDAREASRALLAAEPERFLEQVDALRKALASVQSDIEALRVGGRDVLSRSTEVANELNAAEAELQADNATKEFARQCADVVSRATMEQQSISRLFCPRENRADQE